MSHTFLMPLGFLNLGGAEVFVILLIVLLLFGSKKIPELAKGLGKGMRQFKDAMNGVQTEIQKEAGNLEKNTKITSELGINELKDTVNAAKDIQQGIKNIQNVIK